MASNRGFLVSRLLAIGYTHNTTVIQHIYASINTDFGGYTVHCKAGLLVNKRLFNTIEIRDFNCIFIEQVPNFRILCL